MRNKCWKEIKFRIFLSCSKTIILAVNLFIFSIFSHLAFYNSPSATGFYAMTGGRYSTSAATADFKG